MRASSSAFAGIAAAACAFLAVPSHAATTIYSNWTSFRDATVDRTEYGFEGIASAGTSQYIPGSLSVGPATFTSNGNLFVIDRNGGYGNYPESKFDAQIAPPTALVLNVAITGNFTAVSLEVGSYIGIFGVDVRVNGTEVYSFSTPSNAGIDVTFVGITSTTAIKSVSLTTTSNPLNNSLGNYSGLDIPLFQTATAVSEGSTLSLMVGGLVALTMLRKARRSSDALSCVLVPALK